MNYVQKVGAITALSVLVTAGVAFAQTVPTVGVTTAAPSTAVTPGATGATVTTLTLTGNQSGNYQVTSIPVSLSLTNGAVAGSLTNCQAYNSAGQAISSGANVVGTLQAGNNTIVLDSPLSVAAGVPTSITIRCNVSSAATTGGIFNFAAGAPSFAPGLAVNLAVSPTVAPGQSNAAVALISLDASRSSQGVNVTSIPLTASFTGASNLTGCQVRNIANLGGALNTGANVVGTVGSGINTITLDAPFTVNAGSVATLVVTCNVSAGAAIGSTAALSVNPGTFAATNAATGAVLVPSAGGPSGTNGITSGTLTFGTASTPGVPNTGAGGDFTTTLAVLALSLAMGLGGAYLVKKTLA